LAGLFGTDGIRDVALRGALSPDNLYKIGRALGHIAVNEPELLGAKSAAKPAVLLARDTRTSGVEIRDHIGRGLISVGVRVFDAGVAATPAAAYLTRAGDYVAGIVLSASHNPAEYNGVKVFDRRGFKASDEAENRIEKLVDAPSEIMDAPRPGFIEPSPASIGRYMEHIRSAAAAEFSLSGYKVVLDLANGATCSAAPQIFASLGAKVVPINARPDGKNINLGCGALHPEGMAKEVVSERADAGFAFDGDGDRVIFADETGRVLDGDFLMAVCARYLKEKGRLRENLVVATVMSNIGLERSLAEAGIRLVRAPVGDRFVVEEMQKTGAALGGEQSGHIIFFDRTTTGDGIASALALMEVVVKTKTRLSALAACMKSYPQVLVNVRVRERRQFMEIEQVRLAHDEIVRSLGSAGRVLLRYSGTEPLARVMIEGENQADIERNARKLADAIRNSIGE
jgi:phosphoglucosamine mutase